MKSQLDEAGRHDDKDASLRTARMTRRYKDDGRGEIRDGRE